MKASKFGHMAVLMAAAEVAASTSTGAPVAAPAASGAAPDSNVAAAAKPKRQPKNPENILNIINGRLPLPLVFLIRFKESGTTADRAKKYGTSVGKVFDITKNRNFGYVDANYKPSAEEVEAAKAWCTAGKTAKGQSLKEAGGDPDAILKLVSEMGVATADEVAKRGWQIRTVGQPSEAKTAPVAGEAAAAPAAAAAKTAAKPAGDGAKLF